MAMIADIQNFEREDGAFTPAIFFSGTGVKASSAALPARDNRLVKFLLISLFIHGALLVAAFVFFLDSPSGSGQGLSFVMVEVSGLAANGGDGGGSGDRPSSVQRDKAGGLPETITAPVIKVRKRDRTLLAKKASLPVKAEKEAKRVKAAKVTKAFASHTPPPPLTSVAHKATTEEAAVEQGKPVDKTEDLLTAHPATMQTAIAPAEEGTNFLLVEDSSSTGVYTPQTLTGDVSAISYVAPSLPAVGQGRRGDEAVGEKEQAGAGGHGAFIQGLKPPPYPPFSRLRGEEGTVKLQVQVGPDGRGAGISLLRSSGFAGLDRAALRALEKARFIPATSRGRSAASVKTVVFVFKLKD